MSDNRFDIKLNIETLLNGEPEELEYIRQAIREKRERDEAKNKRGMCYVTVLQGYMLDALHLPKNNGYEIIATKVDCDGDIVLCITGEGLPIVDGESKIPHGNLVFNALYQGNGQKCIVGKIEFYREG